MKMLIEFASKMSRLVMRKYNFVMLASLSAQNLIRNTFESPKTSQTFPSAQKQGSIDCINKSSLSEIDTVKHKEYSLTCEQQDQSVVSISGIIGSMTPKNG